ncbi:MAG: long-chain fatty acid--CoA ligase [Chloroflexi bacterium]|nr:long-chain fatty acid--CoA ligase [Chloroflexota bacterium]
MEKPWLAFYDDGVPARIDYPQVPVDHFVTDSTNKYPDNTALIFYNRKLTYRQFESLVDRFAAGLQALGVQKGDRVAVHLPNCPQHPIAYYGVLRAGGIVVPCNPLYVARELEHQLLDSGAQIIVTLSSFYGTVQQVRQSAGLRHVIVARIKDYFPPLLALLFTLLKEKKEGHYVDISGDADTIFFTDFVKNAPPKPKPVEVLPEDTGVLMYTGGTTGVPKGAQLTHRNLLANALQTRHWVSDVQPGAEVLLTALPLFHSFGMTTCMNLAAVSGAAMLLIPNPRDIKNVLTNINKHQPTLFPGVPTMYVAINNHPEIAKYNVRSVRACISGAAPLPVEVQTKFQDLTGAKLVEGYGLSEATPVTHANPIQGQNKIGTIGLPFPDTEAKIVDLDTGEQELPSGEIGELVVRGPQVMKGYWNMPTETTNVLRNGWLHTGDIARMDEQGYFSVVDRKKDMIIAGGFNIYPRDIEEVLYEHPKVKEVVAAGVPDAYRGETVKAYVVLKDGQTATEEELIEFCRQNLAKYKVPRAIEFRSELPKTMVGKILRRALVEEERRKQAGA